MPNISLSETAFAELKSLAEPFVDTPESLIASLIHAEVIRRGLPAKNGKLDVPTPMPLPTAIQLNPDTHPSLAFSRVISATVDGQPIHRPKWNTIMVHMHLLSLKRLGSFEALRRASGASLRKGQYEDEGFKYISEGDFSVQGVDANKAWDHSLKLARAVKVDIHVLFEWRDFDEAAHPGKTGILEWSSTVTV